MKKDHIVPLARQTIKLFREQQELAGYGEYIFPNNHRSKDHMSNNTLLMALRRMGYQGQHTGHGFRATAMTTIKERLNYRHEVIDRQLAHVPANKVDLAYDRAKYLDERRTMMQDWVDYIDKITVPGHVEA